MTWYWYSVSVTVTCHPGCLHPMECIAATSCRASVAVCLQDVVDGRVPKDRIALKVLHEEMVNWPFLEVEGSLA